jgi:hypothetical protein
MFSTDGYEWHTSATQPFTTQVLTTNGETVTVSTRERPKMLFDETGKPTHLITGVCSATACPEVSTGCVDCKYTYNDYTLVQPFEFTNTDI